MYEAIRLEVLKSNLDMEYKNTQRIREELQKDIEEYLANGGEIEIIELTKCAKHRGWKEAHAVRAENEGAV